MNPFDERQPGHSDGDRRGQVADQRSDAPPDGGERCIPQRPLAERAEAAGDDGIADASLVDMAQ